MSKVLVIDTYGKPLNPVHPGRARLLLTQGKAAVYRRFPFTEDAEMSGVGYHTSKANWQAMSYVSSCLNDGTVSVPTALRP